MTIQTLLILLLVACSIRLAARGPRRALWLLAANVAAVYWLQPALPVRGLDFWLPTLTVALTAITWMAVTPAEARPWAENWPALALSGGLVLLLGLSRYVLPPGWLTPSRPPEPLGLLIALALAALILWLLARQAQPQKWALAGLVGLLLGVFVVLKAPVLSTWTSAGLRWMNGQSTQLAAALDVRWLGYSYIAFRLLHTLRDRQNGRLPAVSFADYASYVLFFPALPAGPIDRLERFLKDLRRDETTRRAELGIDLAEGGQRLVLGLFKKFVLADALSFIALNSTLAAQVRSTGWLWVMVYAYAFQIYFDFAGYTDIALGLGRMMGVRLPENFHAPYTRTNLTLFWNNWHMTLTQWFRAYFFNPFSRWLRTRSRPLSMGWLVLIGQVSTMLLIGLWHGISANFVVWGLWHGLGLFVQNRWSEFARARLPEAWLDALWGQRILAFAGWLLTFNFVALGWVWFALPDLADGLRVFGALFGVWR